MPTIDQHILYVDNFRGFRDTYVPIADVTFMVGENSTGKTSLLSLLKLMSGERLLYGSLFTAEGVNLGMYKDIATPNSAQPDSFRIGMIRRLKDGKSFLPMGALITYSNHDGVPLDTRFDCTIGENEFSLVRKESHIYYRVSANSVNGNTDMKELFKAWIEQGRRGLDGFQKMDGSYGEDTPLIFPLSLLQHTLGVGKSDQFVGPIPSIPPQLFPSMTWLAPIRTKPKRTYDELRQAFSAEGMHTPYVLRKILESGSDSIRFRKRLEKIGKESGLFQSIEIKRYEDDASGPFEVRIILGDRPFNITSVGYGVSQVLPVLVEMISRSRNSWFAIQQPEVHLHPRAQAAIGDLVFTLAQSQNKRFLIETHSDFLIDRFRINYKTHGSRKPKSQILFFERKNGENTVAAIEIDDTGSLSANQPKSYRKFFFKETVKLLDL